MYVTTSQTVLAASSAIARASDQWAGAGFGKVVFAFGHDAVESAQDLQIVGDARFVE